PWKVRYVRGDQSFPLRGLSKCRFAHRKITTLSDTMDPEEVRRWSAEAQRQVSAPTSRTR
ncbi:MAG TPA: hypothetical protein VIU61_21500, partial [Kofleriaceae bacterium]